MAKLFIQIANATAIINSRSAKPNPLTPHIPETDMQTIIGKTFKPGDKVECNGNKDATVIGYYSTAMVEVRLWDGSRLVGTVCVPECDVKPLNPAI